MVEFANRVGPDETAHNIMSCHIWSFTVCCVVSEFSGAPVAQWVKPWPTDLAAAGSNPA